MRLVLRLDLPADARFLTMARRAMDEYLDEAGLVGDEREDLVLALDEACANVIRHAFPGGSGRISMTAERCEQEVVVQVEDDGVGFDASAPRPKPGPYDTSGRGLSIIRGVMTSVDVDSSAGGTRVVMRKVLSGGAHDLELAAH
ncbi:MAG TPA: ATP-binding protein [Acidimicrobiales bacterium]|jgi:anti-sigma regulatory factor (Ser/Thr protein kinase)|nr:ATP-binding protein [Acidimicrobiales bacterium]